MNLALWFAHTVHSDVSTALFLFNNCRLTCGSLILFESNQFELVARCLDNTKTRKVSEIVVYLHSKSQRFFANVSLNFSNSNCRFMAYAHVAKLLSVIQWG